MAARAASEKKTRRSRASRGTRGQGEDSRQRILDAATEIAGERGYDGTSIALVCKRSGLPASSVYWHFEDKDQLIAAVIERSFDRWLAGMRAWVPPPPDASREERFAAAVARTAKALTDAPDFLRLGLMLSLERRPEEATARTKFLQVREQTYQGLVTAFEEFFEAELDARAIRSLATLTMASVDGLFIAHEIDDAMDLGESFELLAAAILAAVEHLRSRSDRGRTAKT